MVRRGHRASSRPSAGRSPSRSYAPNSSRAASPPATDQKRDPASVMKQETSAKSLQQPSMGEQMAATAAGVAVGSAVGSVVGQGITGMFSGSSDNKEATAPVPNASQPTTTPTPAHQQYYANGVIEVDEMQGPCAREIKQFLQCAQEQSDISLCQGFNEALKQCKAKHYSC
uniref:CHCH domain-containing protein n=1 Tax=Glossina brevipalpis TaxID=37001 RepID=A0A1A9W154_9MUSC